MRIALHARLRPGTEDAYDAAHRDDVPPELVTAMREAGAREWTIWRCGTDTFHLVECDDYVRLLANLADVPVNVVWQERMATEFSAAGADPRDDGSARQGMPVVWELDPR